MNTAKCCALNGDGKKCSREADVIVDYHGDHEIYGGEPRKPQWVRVNFCRECARNIASRKELRRL